MRKHRIFEVVSPLKLTVQCPCLTPRQLMAMLSEDIQVDIKGRAGLYGNGSESFPIPRTMSIARVSNMTPKMVKETPPEE